MPRYVLTLEPAPHPEGVPEMNRLRSALKTLGRRYLLRCVDAREEPPVPTVWYVLDDRLQCVRQGQVCVPCVGDDVAFVVRPSSPVAAVFAAVTGRRYYPDLQEWRVDLSRHPDGVDCPLSPQEEAAWRRAGFRDPGPPEPPSPYEEVAP